MTVEKVAKFRYVEDRWPGHTQVANQLLLTDGGPWCEHNVACGVCGDKKAIFDLTNGVFRPCDDCNANGWKLILKKKRHYWWQFWRTRDRDDRRGLERDRRISKLSS